MKHINAFKKPQDILIDIVNWGIAMCSCDGSDIDELLAVSCQQHEDCTNIIHPRVSVNKDIWNTHYDKLFQQSTKYKGVCIL